MTIDPPPSLQRPFYQLLGITSLGIENGRAVMVMAESPMVSNSRGEVHGGATFSLLDAACAHAARAAAPVGQSAATINLTITYMAPGRGKLTARGLVLRAGKTVVAVEAEATDEQGQMVAKAFGTMRVFTPRS